MTDRHGFDPEREEDAMFQTDYDAGPIVEPGG